MFMCDSVCKIVFPSNTALTVRDKGTERAVLNGK